LREFFCHKQPIALLMALSITKTKTAVLHTAKQNQTPTVSASCHNTASRYDLYQEACKEYAWPLFQPSV
jgi:hypothetical protein